MGKVNYTTEQIIVKLREVEVLCRQGKTIGEAVRQIGVTEQSYYRWRRKYGGMTTSDARKVSGTGKRKCQTQEAGSGSIMIPENKTDKKAKIS